jgi:inward rectifier potassium channel
MSKHNHEKQIGNTGFDSATNTAGGRVLSKDGRTNVKKIGMTYFKQMSLYHTLIEMSLFQFLSLCMIGFVLVNIIFGSLYYFLCPGNIGIDPTHSKGLQFIECIFFSAQTITTVGYGRVNPQSIPTGIIASFEAFIGLLTFAVLTGLIYGRFSRPQAFLRFSHHALISPYQDGNALMMRLASFKNNNLTDLEATLIIGMKTDTTNVAIINYYPCKLEISNINALALSWTIVHKIVEDSPIYGMSIHELKSKQVECLLFIKAFDEHFSNIVKSKTSYHHTEIIEHAKFDLMFKQSDDGNFTILDLDKLNDYKILEPTKA